MVNLTGTGIEIIISAKDAFSKVFNKANLSLKSFQKSALAFTAIGGGIAFALGKAVQTSIDFESAFTGVRKTVDLSEKGFADLEKRFKELSTETGTTFVELSRIGEIAGQLGVEGVDNLTKFTSVIADIAVTTNLTSEEAAVSFARIANVMGEPISNVDRMGSAIVDLGNNFATSEQEIVNMSMRIMGAGKTIGLNTQEVFGMSAALSALGIRSEMGGSAISRAMITISKSVAEGGDELEKYAEVSGMSIEQFSTAWKEKPVEAMSAVIMGLKNISESGGNTFGVLEDLDLKSIRITDTMLRLASSEDGITGAVDRSSLAWEENTALTEEAGKRYATLEREIAKTKARFAILGDEIGDRIAPLIRDFLLPALDKLIGFWQTLSPQMQDSILIFAGVTAGVFLLAGAIALLTLVASPWLLILFGIAAAITALILLIKNWDLVILGFTKVFLQAAGLMDKAWQSFKDGFTIALEVMKNVVITVWNFIVNHIENQIQAVISTINFLIRALNKVPGISIPIIPDIDLSKVKGQITDISALTETLRMQREARAIEFAAVSQELFDRIAIKRGFEPTGENMTIVNIEKIEATDAESVADALEETLKDKINF